MSAAQQVVCVSTFSPHVVVILSTFISPSFSNFLEFLVEYTHLPGADHWLGEPTPPVQEVGMGSVSSSAAQLYSLPEFLLQGWTYSPLLASETQKRGFLRLGGILSTLLRELPETFFLVFGGRSECSQDCWLPSFHHGELVPG